MTDPTPRIEPEDDAPPGRDEVAAQVQDAVLSIVAVGRSLLDVVERLARDPGPILDAVQTFAAAGRSAAGQAAQAARSAAEDQPGPPRRPVVEHIRVEPPED